MNAQQSAASSISIREATPEDQTEIERLRRAVGWSTADTGLTSMIRGRSVIYMLEVDGQVAATGALVLRSDDADLADGRANALVSNLIVSPEYQGQGLGSELLRFLEDQARSRGYRRVVIGVDLPNVGARRLYERKGYDSFKDKIEAWGSVNYLAKWLDRES